MKKTFVTAGLAVALLAMPLTAEAANFRSGFTIAIGNVKAAPAAFAGQNWRRGNDTDYRAHQNRIRPLANIVRELERKSGGTVTDIKLTKNNRYYDFEGVTKRGFVVTAKADAYSGQVSNISVKNFRPRYDVHATDILPLLASLRDKGFHSFDLVSLKEEKDIYRVRGLNRKGKPVMIRADAHNGKILSTRTAPGYNGPSYARAEYRDFSHWQAGLKQQHYSRFSNVVAYDDYYDVNAHDGRGRKVQLEVCAFTGEVLGQRTL
ncbi:MAG: hypothetical protein CVT73_05575 [Alphaproteobacteria bacterium HGW-Alphaproteobacteria-12]|nr:MAG: hypothetical protein CVT73_05575 [Alphaproteobacteria bacterium HGW-Alphaproteobacteria-12]